MTEKEKDSVWEAIQSFSDTICRRIREAAPLNGEDRFEGLGKAISHGNLSVDAVNQLLRETREEIEK
jgi:hypothetical protein